MNVSEYLKSYSGPVTILRRNRDEIMQRNPQQTNQNRANYLLVEFMKTRYPHLMNKENFELLLKGLSTDSDSKYRRWIGTVGLF